MSVAVGAVLARGAETSSSELCLKRGLETTISESGTDPGGGGWTPPRSQGLRLRLPEGPRRSYFPYVMSFLIF